MPQQTLVRLFTDSVNRYADNALMWEKRGEHYQGLTYAQAQPLVHRFAAGLMSLGLQKGDRVALISEGRNDWVIAELGILFAGGVNVPISIRVDELSDLKFRLAHAGCRLAVVSLPQLEKIRACKGDLAELERTIVFDPPLHVDADEMTRDSLLAEGERFLTAQPHEFARRWQDIGENDIANICYTSGTTADPKGIMLTHRNYTANVEQGNSIFAVPADFVTLLILPWDHAFGHTCGVYIMMKNGASFASVQQGRTTLETLRNIPANIREIRPTFLLSAPALAKNFRKGIEKNVREQGSKIEALINRALKLAMDYYGDGFRRGHGLKILKKPLVMLADRLVFAKIRQGFGGRLQYFVGGAALLDIELQRFFYAIGMPMYQGYGLTEAAPIISANAPKAHKLGSSGRAVANLELRIGDETGKPLPPGEKGEIMVRGENVMAGYWKNERATREALVNGWLHTGDLGYIDSDGFLYVLGRYKSLLIASDGEKFSPEGIEEAVCERSPVIEQMMLYNEQSPYTVALVVPDKEALLRHLTKCGLSCRERSGQIEALRLIQQAIDAFRAGGDFAGMFPSRWLPSAIAVLGEPFSEQNHFLNSTMKMVRGRISEYYRPRIEYMYSAEGKDILNQQNLTIVSRLVP